MKPYLPNPHYLEFRGQPRLLIGSGEHYGAVLNADFDYVPYIETLAHHDLNQVRIFSGTYRERPGDFGIATNTLAPLPGHFICPWVEAAPETFDLTQFNPAYFARLKDFLRRASAAEIAVELVLFCFWYSPDFWTHSPMHPARSLQGIGPTDKELVYTLGDNPLLPVQEAFVRKIVAEVNEFDNVYFEVCNEPYSRHDHTFYLDWQHHIAEVIAEMERGLPNKHLVAINYHNRTFCIPEVHPAVSILNFHYALPEAVKSNRHFNRPIADDETGFQGQTAAPYRKEAWNFFFAGGAVFSHLDYGFTCEYPDGSAPLAGNTPGYGGDDLRQQLVFLRHFLEENQVWRLRPANELFAQIFGTLPGQALCDPGKTYLLYFPENSPGRAVALWLPVGEFHLEWVNPTGCRITHTETITNPGAFLRLITPDCADDLALKMTRL